MVVELILGDTYRDNPLKDHTNFCYFYYCNNLSKTINIKKLKTTSVP